MVTGHEKCRRLEQVSSWQATFEQVLSLLCSVKSSSETPWTVTHLVPLSIGLPRQYTKLGFHFLLHRIFPTQGSNSCLLNLLHWQTDYWPPGHTGSLWARTICENRTVQPSSWSCWKESNGYFTNIHYILWRRAWQPTPVFLPGESHG